MRKTFTIAIVCFLLIGCATNDKLIKGMCGTGGMLAGVKVAGDSPVAQGIGGVVGGVTGLLIGGIIDESER